MEGIAFWTLAVIAASCIGLSKGGVPASSVLAVPLLSLVISPVVAAGLLLPVLLISDVFGLWAYWRHTNWAVIRIAVFGLVIGTGIGWATAHIVSEDLVRVVIGGIGLAYSVNFLLASGPSGAAQPAHVTKGVFWSSVAGFTSFVSHAGAPPWQVWTLPQKMTRLVFTGTSAWAFAIMNVLKIVPYYYLGQLQAHDLRVTVILFIPAIVAVFVAYQLVRVLSDKVFYAVVTWMLLAVSIKLIWDGIGL